ncbi:MAG: hypothetical protein HN909_00485 [Phycisphaerales bacterium]|nr:hypothetical protein [Phycisphaerales bacterium]MBT7170225.1 hypothetical protein [Phycisphaerales bacterium]
MKRRKFSIAVLACLLTAQVGLGDPKWLTATGTSVSSRQSYSDSKGFQWDVNCYNGCLARGTSHVFSDAADLHVNGSSFNSSSGRGTRVTHTDGVEFVFGPTTKSNLKVYRRVKFFKSGLCRIVDSYYNASGSEQTPRIEVRSSTNYGMQNVTKVGDDGKKNPTGVVLESYDDDCPLVLLLARGKQTEQPPMISASSNSSSYHLRWAKLTVPAGDVVSVVYFFRQDNSQDDLQKFATTFDVRKWTKDLPAELRNSVVNFDLHIGSFHVSIPRSTLADRVELVTGNTIYGTIRNKSYKIKTPLGPLTLDASKVIGLARAKDAKGNIGTILLADGQVVTGSMLEKTMTIEVPGAGILTIPFEKMRSFGYVISKVRPEEVKFQGPYMGLRSGMRIRFAPESMALKLKRSTGEVNLPPKVITKITCTPDAETTVLFSNRSVIAGKLHCDAKAVKTDLWGPRALDAGGIVSISYAESVDRKTTLPLRIQCGKEIIYGEIVAESLKFATPYGECKIAPMNITNIGPDPAMLRSVASAESHQVAQKSQLKRAVELSLQKASQLHSTHLQTERNIQPYWVKVNAGTLPATDANYKKCKDRCDAAQKALDTELNKLRSNATALWAMGEKANSRKMSGFKNYAAMWSEKVKKSQIQINDIDQKLATEETKLAKLKKDLDAEQAKIKPAKGAKSKKALTKAHTDLKASYDAQEKIIQDLKLQKAGYAHAMRLVKLSSDFYDRMLAAYTAMPDKTAKVNLKTRPTVAVKFAGTGTVLVGHFVDPTVSVKITDDVVLSLNPATITIMTNSAALPVGVVNDSVKKLISQLGSGNYVDRKEAFEALKKMGPGIKPILLEHKNSPDAEVRMRVEELLKGL